MSVTVVMPAYNAAPFIREAIGSVIAQTYTGWELLVINDQSTDATAAIVQDIDDPRVRLVHAETKLYASGARQLGTDLARSEYINYLDADDRLSPEALMTLMEGFRMNPAAGLVYANYRRIDASGRPYGARRFTKNLPRPSGDVLRDFLLQNRMVNGGLALIRRAVLLETGGWSRDLRHSEDWVMWVLLAALTPFCHLPGCILLDYRDVPTGLSHSIGSDWDLRLKAIERVYTHPLVQSRIPAAELAALRPRTEAHVRTLLAGHALRNHQFGAAFGQLARAIRTAPLDSPRSTMKFALALADLLI